MTTYDWPSIRERYVTGNESLRDLAGHDHMPAERTLFQRSRDEDWPGQRSAYRQQVATKTRERASAEQAEVAARHARMAQALQAKGLRALQELEPATLTPYQLIRLVQVGADIERKALQMDEVQLHANLNYDDLTLDQLKRIAAGEDPARVAADG